LLSGTLGVGVLILAIINRITLVQHTVGIDLGHCICWLVIEFQRNFQDRLWSNFGNRNQFFFNGFGIERRRIEYIKLSVVFIVRHLDAKQFFCEVLPRIITLRVRRALCHVSESNLKRLSQCEPQSPFREAPSRSPTCLVGILSL